MRVTRAAIGFLFLCSAVSAPAQDQQYSISTYAGVPRQQTIVYSLGVAADADGNVYFSRSDYDGVLNVEGCFCVLKLGQNGVVTRVAGNSQAGYSGDGGPAAGALLNRPAGLAVDGAGNLFIVDTGNNRIRRISSDGTIITVAGDGTFGDSGDGGPATSAPLRTPRAVAADAAGNLFVAYDSRRVRKVSPDGIITTVAGNGMYGISGDGGPATSAQIGSPSGVAVDGSGNLFIAGGCSVRKVSPDGIITTVAGVGCSSSYPWDDCTAGLSGDGAPATQAHLCTVSNVVADRVGNLFINESGYSRGDASNFAVRKISPDGIVTTVAGDGLQLAGLWQTAVDGAGNLFIADGSIRKITPEGIVTTVAGWGACCYSGDGGPATSAEIGYPSGVGVDGAGDLFIADQSNHRIRRVSPDGNITTVAGGTLSVRCLALAGESGPAAGAQLCQPDNIAVDPAGNVFIADYNRVRKVSPDGTITVVAGNGSFGYSGDGGLATDAQLGGVSALAAGDAGNLFLNDFLRIRKVSPDGIITTVAGNGAYGNINSADGVLAINTPIGVGGGIAVDGAGNLFFADGTRIRKVSSDGILTTVAGGGEDSPGDGGPATSARIIPSGVAVDRAGNLFISHDGRIGKVSPNGIITTIAGGGANDSLEGGLATDAKLSPSRLVVDGAGNVYFIESPKGVVRILRPINNPF